MAKPSNSNKGAVATQPQAKGVVVAKPNLPAFIPQTEANAGFDQAGREAFAIPFLAILQSNSPQVNRADGAYIKGAQGGMLLDTAGKRVFEGEETGLEFIPCMFTNTFVEWKLREAGGGFVAEYDNMAGRGLQSQTKRDDKNRDILPSRNQLTDHRNHYIIYKDPETGLWQPALLSLTSTQIKKSRNFMTSLQRVAAANSVSMFANICRIRTVAESNEKGSWFGVNLELEGFVTEEQSYEVARQFYKQASSGGVKTQARDANESGAPDNTDPGDM